MKALDSKTLKQTNGGIRFKHFICVYPAPRPVCDPVYGCNGPTYNR